MKITNKYIQKVANKETMIAFGLLALAGVAQASVSTVSTGDPFYEFYNNLKTWMTGGLGIGLAFAFLIFGGIVGVAKNSPVPALAGVVAAAFFKFAPDMIEMLLLTGATLEKAQTIIQSFPML